MVSTPRDSDKSLGSNNAIMSAEARTEIADARSKIISGVKSVASALLQGYRSERAIQSAITTLEIAVKESDRLLALTLNSSAKKSNDETGVDPVEKNLNSVLCDAIIDISSIHDHEPFSTPEGLPNDVVTKAVARHLTAALDEYVDAILKRTVEPAKILPRRDFPPL
jgi:hypothetical protein